LARGGRGRGIGAARRAIGAASLAVLAGGCLEVPEPDDVACRGRIVVDVAPDEAEEDLLDVPVLLRFDASSRAALGVPEVPSTMRVLNAEGNPLPYEIAASDEAGPSRVWVRLDRIPAGASAVELRIDGLAAFEEGPDPIATWLGFGSVWHLNEPTGDALLDSTEVVDLEVPAGTGGSRRVEAEIDGSIDGSMRFFSPGDGAISDGVPDTEDGGQEVTVEIRLRLDDLDGVEGEGLTWPGLFALRPIEDDGADGGYFLVERSPSAVSVFGTEQFLPATWIDLVGTYGADGVPRLYVDGVQVAMQSAGDGLGPPAGPIVLGDGMHGAIDEARISYVARAPAWIALQHRLVDDPDAVELVDATCP
jgi:hypothetical protein